MSYDRRHNPRKTRAHKREEEKKPKDSYHMEDLNYRDDDFLEPVPHTNTREDDIDMNRIEEINSLNKYNLENKTKHRQSSSSDDFFDDDDEEYIKKKRWNVNLDQNELNKISELNKVNSINKPERFSSEESVKKKKDSSADTKSKKEKQGKERKLKRRHSRESDESLQNLQNKLKNGCCKQCMKAFSRNGKSCLCQVPRLQRRATLPSNGCKFCGCKGCNPMDIRRDKRQTIKKKLKEEGTFYQKRHRLIDSDDESLILSNDFDKWFDVKKEFENFVSYIMNQDGIKLGFGFPMRTPSYILGAHHKWIQNS